jgi:hypothetical protein
VSVSDNPPEPGPEPEPEPDPGRGIEISERRWVGCEKKSVRPGWGMWTVSGERRGELVSHDSSNLGYAVLLLRRMSTIAQRVSPGEDRQLGARNDGSIIHDGENRVGQRQAMMASMARSLRRVLTQLERPDALPRAKLECRGHTGCTARFWPRRVN